MTTRRTTLILDADLLERLARHAHRARTTKTALVSEALERFLADEEGAPDLSFIGVGRSSHGRLSLDGRSIMRHEAGSRPRGAGGGSQRRRSGV